MKARDERGIVPVPPSSPELPRLQLEMGRMTVGRRWKLKRDLVIYLAATHGASMRLLGDVFDLPHSRISEICKNMREKFANRPDQA